MSRVLWFVAAVVTSVVLSVATIYVLMDTGVAVDCPATMTVDGKQVPNAVTC